MSSSFPIEDRIFVLKNGESLGPFEIEEILERIESGEFVYEDVCLREGAIETERLRQVLDWEEAGPAPEDGPSFEESLDEQAHDEDPAELGDESVLKSTEAILYRGHPSMLTFPLSFIGLTGGIVGAIWLYPIDARFTLLCLTVAVSALAYLSLMRFTRDYFISPKRIEIIRGLIARSSNEVRISDIRAINVSCTGLLGMFGVGDVDFFTAGDSPEVSFTGVWAAKDVKALVRKLQDAGN